MQRDLNIDLFLTKDVSALEGRCVQVATPPPRPQHTSRERQELPAAPFIPQPCGQTRRFPGSFSRNPETQLQNLPIASKTPRITLLPI